MSARAVTCPQVYCIDLLAGVAAIARAFIGQGFAALTFDRGHSEEQNTNTRSHLDGHRLFVLGGNESGLHWQESILRAWVAAALDSQRGKQDGCTLGDRGFRLRHPRCWIHLGATGDFLDGRHAVLQLCQGAGSGDPWLGVDSAENMP